MITSCRKHIHCMDLSKSTTRLPCKDIQKTLTDDKSTRLTTHGLHLAVEIQEGSFTREIRMNQVQKNHGYFQVNLNGKGGSKGKCKSSKAATKSKAKHQRQKIWRPAQQQKHKEKKCRDMESATDTQSAHEIRPSGSGTIAIATNCDVDPKDSPAVCTSDTARSTMALECAGCCATADQEDGHTVRAGRESQIQLIRGAWRWHSLQTAEMKKIHNVPVAVRL